MSTKSRTIAAALLLATIILAATALSLYGTRSFAWSLAAPLVLALGVIGARMVHRHSLRVDLTSAIIAAGLFASAMIVAFADPKSVPMMMPILGACASTVFLQQPRKCAQHVS